jgi:proline iminopeptidase
VISNMMSSVPAYNAYAEQVLMPGMDQAALAEIKSFEAAGETENPRYMQLLYEQHYVHHVLRMPIQEWPDPVQRGFAHINPAIYTMMQGPSELGISPGATLARWDRTDQLSSIRVPTLVIGARYDTMDPAYLEMMADRLPAGRYLYCPEGSHLAMYDDQQAYFAGLIAFLRDLLPWAELIMNGARTCPGDAFGSWSCCRDRWYVDPARAYGVDASVMQLQRHGRGIHIIRGRPEVPIRPAS